jgi:hypothetical protein
MLVRRGYNVHRQSKPLVKWIGRSMNQTCHNVNVERVQPFLVVIGSTFCSPLKLNALKDSLASGKRICLQLRRPRRELKVNLESTD